MTEPVFVTNDLRLMSDYGLQNLFENNFTPREVKLMYWNVYSGHPVVFNGLQDKKIAYSCRQTQQYI